MGDDIYRVVVSELKWVPLDQIGAFESIMASKCSCKFIYHVQWINQWVWFRRHTKFLINGINVSFFVLSV
jgi:hypothetical protein